MVTFRRAALCALTPLLAFAFFGALPGCYKKTSVDIPGPAPKGTYRPYTISGRTYHPLRSAQGFTQTGLASWYGPKFHGRRTANGEVYDMDKMTAAHKILPINTYVRVTNRRNGRSVVVRINDRGPFVDGRVIDLSRLAARRLGVLGPGTAPVTVVALGFRRAGRPGYVQPKSYLVGTFTVQVGAFVDPGNAQRLAARLRSVWGQVFVVRYDRGDRVFHRVRVGKLTTYAQARQLKQRLRSTGMNRAFAVAW